MFRQFWMFIADVLANWQATVTGGFIGVAILLYEHLRKRALTRRALWYLLAIGLFISCFLAWHDEHRNSQILIQEKAGLTGKLASCLGDLKASDVIRGLLDSQVRSQQTAMNTQQSTVNTCVVSLARMAAGEPEQVYVWTVGLGIIKQPVVTEILVVTTKPKTLSGNLKCKEPFQIFDWTLAGASVEMAPSARQIGPTEYHLELMSPTWEPSKPLVVNVVSSGILSDCKFTLQ